WALRSCSMRREPRPSPWRWSSSANAASAMSRPSPSSSSCCCWVLSRSSASPVPHWPDMPQKDSFVTSHDSFVKVRGLKKAYGDYVAVKDISLDVDKGGSLALLGP